MAESPEFVMLGDIRAAVHRRAKRNINISVKPPDGHVRISCPPRHTLERVAAYAIAKLPWIREQRRKIASQARQAPLLYIDKESHYLWGKRLLFGLEETVGTPGVSVEGDYLVVRLRPGTGALRKSELVEEWYRRQLMVVASDLVKKWEPVVGTKVAKLSVRRMRTRWGSCNHLKKTIILNSELARKPRQCVEYLVVHEMTHLLEPSHNERFRSLLTKFLPSWKRHRATLNSLPVRHEDWPY
jgi:predicted metal-dependent hydrolase